MANEWTIKVMHAAGITQEDFDTKLAATTKPLKDIGGTNSKDTDDLPEGTANKYDTGAPPTDSDALNEGVTHKFLSAQQKTDLPVGEVMYVAIEKLAVAPTTPGEGRLYYDTVMGKFRMFKDAAWVDALFVADEPVI